MTWYTKQLSPKTVIDYFSYVNQLQFNQLNTFIFPATVSTNARR